MPARARSDLFELDPAEFVAARDELARELKAQGQPDEAAAIRKLRRPTVAVWAVNQVARQDRTVVDALVSCAADARVAQREAIEQRNPERLREALAARRRAFAKVAKAARSVVEASGRSGDAQERDIDDVLNALIATDRMDDVFRSGALTTLPVAAEDAGDLLAAMADSMPEPQAPEPVRKPSKELVKARDAAEHLRAEAEDARRRVVEIEAELERVENELRVARKAQSSAERALERAEERVAKLDG